MKRTFTNQEARALGQVVGINFKDIVFARMVKPRAYKDETLLSPVAKLQEGSFMIIRVSASFMSYHDYAVN